MQINLCHYAKTKSFKVGFVLTSWNKLKKSESTAAMRFQDFQRAYCGTHTRGEIPEVIFSM
jgi:hypothetical protein